jgi:hypothetical protein
MECLKHKGHGSLRLLPRQDLRGLSFLVFNILYFYGPFMRPNPQVDVYIFALYLSSQNDT